MNKITTEQFIEKARKIHGNKYDYSKTVYDGCKNKIIIICPIHGEFLQTPDKHINDKSGCPKCAAEINRKSKNLSNEEFIERCKRMHGDKYDYSLVNYRNGREKIKIFCKECEEYFYQFAQNHMLGSGHKKCAFKRKKLSKETFIEEAKKTHKDKYDYSLIDYKRTNVKVKIICKIHGIFKQQPINHLRGAGCPFCSKNIKKTQEEFIEKATLVHNNKYDYSLVNYINNKTKVKIICKKHGVFEQLPNSHTIQKCGCPKCANEETAIKQTFTSEKFIEESKKIHGNKYDYSLVDYKNARTKVKIICKKHGMFEQIAYCHQQGAGCPVCNYSKGEERIQNYLIDNNIKFEPQKKYNDLIDNSYLSYDFYIPSKNLLIEFNGMQHYEWEQYFQPTYRDFLVQKHHDWLKRKYAKDNNINLLTIPYWELYNIDKILKEEQIGTSNQSVQRDN